MRCHGQSTSEELAKRAKHKCQKHRSIHCREITGGKVLIEVVEPAGMQLYY
jgi:hypothetical protein